MGSARILLVAIIAALAFAIVTPSAHAKAGNWEKDKTPQSGQRFSAVEHGTRYGGVHTSGGGLASESGSIVSACLLLIGGLGSVYVLRRGEEQHR